MAKEDSQWFMKIKTRSFVMKKIVALFTILAIVAGCVFAGGAVEAQQTSTAAK